MTSRRSTLIVAIIISAIVIGVVVALNTHAAFANSQPTPEPTPIAPVSPLIVEGVPIISAPVIVFVPWLEGEQVAAGIEQR